MVPGFALPRPSGCALARSLDDMPRHADCAFLIFFLAACLCFAVAIFIASLLRLFLLERKQGAKDSAKGVGCGERGAGGREDMARGMARGYGAPFLIPHSLLPIPHSPSEHGIVIALKISHYIHIAFVSPVTQEAVWMVMI